MKKFLLSSAMFGAALSLSTCLVTQANAATVKKPTLKISGEATASYHIFDNNVREGTEKGLGSSFNIEDSSLYFDAGTRMDWFGTMFINWRLGISGDTGRDDRSQIEENFLKVKGEWGTFIFGNSQGVESLMARGAFGVMGGTGGFDGNMFTVVEVPTGVFVRTDLVGSTRLSTKATYVTPRLWGVQLGVSYTPSTEQRGEGRFGMPHNRTSIADPVEPFDVNHLAGGINYAYGFENGINVQLSATGVIGKTHRPDNTVGLDNFDDNFTFFKSARRDRTAAYAIGGTIEFRGFEFGAEWLDNGDSRQFKKPQDAVGEPGLDVLGGFDAGSAYSFAAAYTYGPDRLSIGYYHSDAKFNGDSTDADIYSVVYDREVAPGFGVFTEYNNFGLKSGDNAAAFANSLRGDARDKRSETGNGSTLPKKGINGNNGHVLTLGMKFKF